MINPQPLSWFYENLPDMQIIEDRYKDIIKKNYNLSGFVSLDTPSVERLEVLTSKWADDSEIYALKRIHAEEWEKLYMWLRFDLTVPLARYIAQYEWNLTFPFKRQQIARVYRWERPQKWRYREFYQADIDIIWNWKLPMFADVEILSSIYNALIELNFWEFTININNKKFLSWYLNSIWISKDKIVSTIGIIDKKNKVSSEKLREIFITNSINDTQIVKINEFINFWEENSYKDLVEKFLNTDDLLLKEGIDELIYVYENLLALWVDKKYIKVNPSISRWLDYYTWTVFETFINWAESLWSVSSWWRYENLASNFTKNNFPWVWGSIWISRLLAVLNSLWKIELWSKTITKVLVVNMWDNLLIDSLKVVHKLRKVWVNVEIYLDWTTKIQKQLKYANNKKIPFVIIQWEAEIENWIVQLKNLENWEQKEIKFSDLEKYFIY